MDLGLNPSGKRVGPVIQPSTRICLSNPQKKAEGDADQGSAVHEDPIVSR